MLNSRKWVVVVFWGLGLLFFSQCEKFKTPLELRWKTYCEKVDFKRTPRYAETIKFCKRLARVSRYVSFKSFGISPQGRKLPLLKDREELARLSYLFKHASIQENAMARTLGSCL